MPLIEDVAHPEDIVRRSAAKALEKTLSCNADSLPAALQELISRYEDKLYVGTSTAHSVYQSIV